jgi:drug/metabolite transporter (DMT)-like permease
MIFCAFELQKCSDPVFYSQLGSVAAVFGLLIGVVWFNEVYSMQICLGVLLVIFGLRMSNKTSTIKLSLLKRVYKTKPHSNELEIK